MPDNRITPADEVCQQIAIRQDAFKSALPAGIPVERFIRVAQTCIRLTPALLEADRASLYASIMRCAQDGLLPDGREAAIITFGGKATYMPMVNGICKRARNSGEIKSIGVQTVYEKDTYDSWEDEHGPHFKFKKAAGDRGAPILTYAYVITKDDGVYFEEIGEEAMASIQAMSKSATVWKGPFRDEMKKKSVLRRLLKHRVPSSADLDNVVHADDDLYEDEPKPKAEAQPTSSRLRQAIDVQSAPSAAQPGRIATAAISPDDIPL